MSPARLHTDERRPVIETLHVDCMEYMSTLPNNAFDLAIVDPPYGIGMKGHRFNPGNYPTRQKNGRSLLVKRNDYGTKEWDNKPPSRAYFKELRRVSRDQVIWGANHFINRMPFASSCWLVWDKCNGGTNQADAELAWTSFCSAVRLFPFMWNGMIQGSIANGREAQGDKRQNERRIHPTQKPVQLYRWILKNYAQPGMRILDTHAGSMSLGVACAIEGYDAVLCEKDADYFRDGTKRLRQAEQIQRATPKLFPA